MNKSQISELFIRLSNNPIEINKIRKTKELNEFLDPSELALILNGTDSEIINFLSKKMNKDIFASLAQGGDSSVK